MRKNMLAMAVLISVLVSGGPEIWAGSVTYKIINNEADQNGFTLEGTIVTDGTFDYLQPKNILSWEFTITGNSGTSTTTKSTDENAKTDLSFVIATENAIYVDGSLSLQGKVNILWEPTNPTYMEENPTARTSDWDTNGAGYGPVNSSWEVAVVPEPTSLILALSAVCCVSLYAFCSPFDSRLGLCSKR